MCVTMKGAALQGRHGGPSSAPPTGGNSGCTPGHTQAVLVTKNPPANAGDLRDARPGRFSGEGNGNPLQYSCLEDPMDRGAWWATVRGVAKSCTQLSNEHFLSAGHTNHFQQGHTHMLCGYCRRSRSSAWRVWGPCLYTS